MRWLAEEGIEHETTGTAHYESNGGVERAGKEL